MVNDPLAVTGPTMKRGKSAQDVQTPPDFMAAIKKRFGPISFDLAATEENKQHPLFFSESQNSLEQPWHKLNGWLWLNCPYSNIEPWVWKCAAEMELGARILLLTPASVGANWYRQWVRPSAHVIFLNGRIQFVGHSTGFPKDLCLSVYCCGVTGDSIWRWKESSTNGKI